MEISSRDCMLGFKNTLVWMRMSPGGESRHLLKWRAERNAYTQRPEFGFMRWGPTASAMPYGTPHEWVASGLFDVEEVEPMMVTVLIPQCLLSKQFNSKDFRFQVKLNFI